MKFITLSHAGLYVEHNGTSIVTDPWLIGSCYWRSWWNFPEPDRGLLDSLKPNYVYLTHLHWDHFHGISLKKLFGRDTTFLVPKVCTRRMVEDLKILGFRKVVEVPHATEFKLGPDFTLCSYQFGLGVDSAAILKGSDVCLLNANDCKLFGLPLRHVVRRYGKPRFVLRSHSSASPLPYCVEGYKETHADYRTQQDYIEEFSRFAISIGARYAVPFASNHCFLHKETLHFNQTAVTPREVESYCNRLAEEVGAETRCVIMAPGSAWSEEDGFRIVPFDYEKRDDYVRELSRRNEAKLSSYYQEEEKETASFDLFQAYFTRFFRALPRLVARRWRTPIVFRVKDHRGVHHWLLDPPRREVREAAEPPAGAIVIDVPTRVINDCTASNMFSVWTPSKRLKIHLPSPDKLNDVGTLFTLLDAYELDNLPLRKNLRRRNLGVFLRRWREGVEAGRLFLKHFVLRRPFRIRDLYPIPERKPTNASPEPVGSTF